jgi:RHS repeat-associated protein
VSFNTVAVTNPAPDTKGWIGERFDTDTGLQYRCARYYDPQLGMFLQPDWWEVMQPGVGTNRYSYSFGDPVNGIDPSGHEKTGFNFNLRDIVNSYIWKEVRIAAKATEKFEKTVAKEFSNLVLDFTPVVGGVKAAREAKTWLGVGGAAASELIGPIGDGAKLLVNGIKRAIKGAEETTTLYRAVSADEYSAVIASGNFSMGVGSYGIGKQFGLNLKETLKFADYARDSAGVLRVEVPKKVVDGIADRTHVDPFVFKSGTVTIPTNRLRDFNSCIICITDALE